MLRKITDGVDHIYLACGPTDFRKQIPGLTALIQSRFQLDPYTSANLFLFCNRRRTAIKALRYDANGFLLVSKVLMDQQKFSWPKSEKEVRAITQTQFEWLLQGIEIDCVLSIKIPQNRKKNSPLSDGEFPTFGKEHMCVLFKTSTWTSSLTG